MSGSGETPGRKRQPLLPLSTICLLAAQIFFERGCDLGGFSHLVRNSVKELPDAWMLGVFHLIFGSDREERSVVQHGNAIGDAEGTRQLMCYDDHGHLKSFLKKENQFIQFCRNNRVKSSGGFVEYKNFRVESKGTRHCSPLLHTPG